jgi:dienelactone hydrolase
MPSITRFFREFLKPRDASVTVEATSVRRNGQDLPASLYRPSGSARRLPGWLALHGLTWHGKDHAGLRRLARALAAAGNVVLIPDLPEWRALRVAPGPTVETIKSAVLELDSRGITEPGRVGVIGFSFGATQALIAATDASLRDHLAGVAAWGGYADIRAAVRFGFLGQHELDGRTYRADPDPYGRWILAGNYLGLLEEYSGGNPLPGSLLGLAREAGRRSVMSWDPGLDPSKRRARARLEGPDQEVFDLIAPLTGATLTGVQRERLALLADRMVAAALVTDPLLDPAPHLPHVAVPVFLAHGRGDRLIPWTEMVRLRRALPAEAVVRSGITALFAHSTGQRRAVSPAAAVEAVRFVRLMRGMLRLI